jgi:hypothetical protein
MEFIGLIEVKRDTTLLESAMKADGQITER